MPNMICINEVLFFVTLNSLKSGAENIISDVGQLPEITSSADTLQKYREELIAIGCTLEQYKGLLLKDIQAVSKVCSNMVRTDVALAGDMRIRP
ncbi:MAG: hypothetical protein WAX04_11810 [Oscillospiraceae bacterium]